MPKTPTRSRSIRSLQSRRAHVSALSLTLALILLPVAARAAAKDACSLITSADAQAAIGEPVGDAKAENRSFGAGDGSTCRYRSTVGSALKGKSVSVAVHYSATDLTGSAEGIAQNLKSAGFSSVHNVAGIGSAAVWGSTSILGKYKGELTVIQGRSVMLVVIISGIPDEADALARAKAIAAKAIARL